MQKGINELNNKIKKKSIRYLEQDIFLLEGFDGRGNTWVPQANSTREQRRNGPRHSMTV